MKRLVALCGVLAMLLGFGTTRMVSADATTVSSFSFTSQPGDWVGQGTSETLTPAGGASFSVRGYGGSDGQGTYGTFWVNITTATENWTAEFAAPQGQQLKPGTTYTNVMRAPFETGSAAGMAIYGDGRGCNADTGSFTMNALGADLSGAVNTADVSFTQYCDGSTSALTGEVQFQVGLTEPAWPPSQPTSYSFVSPNGDWIGQGATAIYTPATSDVALTGTRQGVSLSVQPPSGASGDNWTAMLAPPSGGTLHLGTFTGAEEIAGSGNPELDVSGDGRGCSGYGSFTITSVGTDASGNVNELAATFSQSCGSTTAPALQGSIDFNVPSTFSTATSLTASRTSLRRNQSVTLTATVVADDAVSGSVSFFDASTGVTLATVPLTGGLASTTMVLPHGSNTVVADYGGDAENGTSASDPVTINVK
jgi:hypothetical protein